MPKADTRLTSKDIVLFSTADWRASVWTNKQHVANTLTELGYRVLYIEGIGMRKPTMAVQDTRRIVRRLKKLLRPLQRERDNLSILSLPFLPWHQNKFAALINRIVIGASIRFSQRRLGFRNPTLWTYHPLTTHWVNPKRYGFSLYHCVDEIGAQPGMSFETINKAEETLARSVNYVCTTAPSLAEKLVRFNPQCEFLPNVADFAHFNQATQSSTALPEDLAKIPGPRVGFIGAISGYKVDFKLVTDAARLRPDVSFVMIGEVGLGETNFNLGELPPNVHVLGPRPYQDLPAYCKGFNVGLLPYHINEYTRGVFPMKLFEYLAAGLPVISTRLPALRDYPHVVSWAETPADLAEKMDLCLNGDCPSRETGFAAARENTYRRRTERMLEVVDGKRVVSSPAAAARPAHVLEEV